jgi:response regulator RpfG family c-di-GMP phosphodiesterase
MSQKILCVDDDPNILAAYQRSLRRRFNIDIALGGDQALAAMVCAEPYAVIVADMNMPGMNGIQFLMEAKQKWPDTVRIMLTGNADQQTAIEAVNKGHIFQFLTKPCPPENLGCALESALKQYALIRGEKELLEKTVSGSIKMLTEILTQTEPEAFGRGEVLRNLFREIAVHLEIQDVWEIELAALLSSIGSITIPVELLKKVEHEFPLSVKEQEIIARIPEISCALVSNIPRLEQVGRIIRYQNKCINGDGWPADSISGEEIPLGSRILKVLSSMLFFEARGFPRSKALEEMRKTTGVYDLKILNAAAACLVSYLTPTHDLPGKAVEVTKLETGQVLLSSVETKDGVLIIPSGTRLTPMLLEKIGNFAQFAGIKEPIYVEG